MESKNLSREYLIEKATKVINAPYTATDEFFYKSPEWIKVENDYIRANPLCELCLSEGKNIKSDDVHHITPLTAGGEPFSEDNLIALCDSCHSSVHDCIAIDISLDSLFSLDHLNNFTTKLRNVDETILSKCKQDDDVVLIREQRKDNSVYVKATTKDGEHLGEIDSADATHHYLAYDIVHGSEVSARINQIFYEKNKLHCIIEIKKTEIDWKEIEKFTLKEKDISELMNKAKQSEKSNPENAVRLYQKATQALKEMDRECEKYPTTWRTLRFPINRISLILEKQKRYKECLEEIEYYEKYNDKVMLYYGELERIEKRKVRILKLL